MKKENDVELERFEIEIKNNFDKKARVHYLIPEEYKKNKNVKLKILQDGNWKEKKFDLDGSYLVVEIDKPMKKIMLERKNFVVVKVLYKKYRRRKSWRYFFCAKKN